MRMKHPGTLTASTCVVVTGHRFHERSGCTPLLPSFARPTPSALAPSRTFGRVPILAACAQFERKQPVSARPFVAANGRRVRCARVPFGRLAQVVDDLLLER